MAIFITLTLILSTLVPPSGTRSPKVATVLGRLLTTVVVTVAFHLAVRGFRRQIRARKAEELSKLRERIHRNRELAAVDAPGGDAYRMTSQQLESGGSDPPYGVGASTTATPSGVGPQSRGSSRESNR